MEIRNEEVLSKILSVTVNHLEAMTIDENIGKPLSSDLRTTAQGPNVLVYDKGNGYGVELLTKRTLPLVRKYSSHPTIKVGGRRSLLFFQEKHSLSSIEELGKYLFNAENVEVANEVYEYALKRAKKAQEAFLSSLKHASLHIAVKDSLDYLEGRYKGSSPISLNRDIIIRDQSKHPCELLTGFPVNIRDLEKTPSSFYEPSDPSYVSCEKRAVTLKDLYNYLSADSNNEIKSALLSARQDSFLALHDAKREIYDRIDDYLDTFLGEVIYKKSKE